MDLNKQTLIIFCNLYSFVTAVVSAGAVRVVWRRMTSFCAAVTADVAVVFGNRTIDNSSILVHESCFTDSGHVAGSMSVT